MESVWEEKKLRALFSELKAADEQTAPRFARVWNRAQLAPRRSPVFNPALVVATLLLACTLISLAVWSRYARQTQLQPVARVETLPAASTTEGTTATITVPPTPTPSKQSGTSRSGSAARRKAMQTAAHRKLTRDAKAITNWESPTSTLLSSASDELFTSLPQLNENASELKSFLPNRPN